MRFGSVLLIKCVQREMGIAITELKNPGCPAEASALRWQKSQARLANARMFRETTCSAIYLSKIFFIIGKIKMNYMWKNNIDI